jgi:hypothetical protein
MDGNEEAARVTFNGGASGPRLLVEDAKTNSILSPI